MRKRPALGIIQTMQNKNQTLHYTRLITQKRVTSLRFPTPRHSAKVSWPPYPMSALSQPPHCPCGHTINFEKSDVFCTKKCGRQHRKNPLVRTGQAPLRPKCGRFLWIAPYEAIKVFNSWILQWPYFVSNYWVLVVFLFFCTQKSKVDAKAWFSNFFGSFRKFG